jgi:hypothetical protein
MYASPLLLLQAWVFSGASTAYRRTYSRQQFNQSNRNTDIVDHFPSEQLLMVAVVQVLHTRWWMKARGFGTSDVRLAAPARQTFSMDSNNTRDVVFNTFSVPM